jgi:hypothetical protein
VDGKERKAFSQSGTHEGNGFDSSKVPEMRTISKKNVLKYARKRCGPLLVYLHRDGPIIYVFSNIVRLFASNIVARAAEVKRLLYKQSSQEL